jgi:hypothetical protein
MIGAKGELQTIPLRQSLHAPGAANGIGLLVGRIGQPLFQVITNHVNLIGYCGYEPLGFGGRFKNHQLLPNRNTVQQANFLNTFDAGDIVRSRHLVEPFNQRWTQTNVKPQLAD